ncbi:MAG: efflux RND transporter permease subunit [Candidatus Omnitrophica bacterium]|nr:efflux RND transporter permease subunit [Candidatus Omnitrophota bacterium]
MKIAEFSVKHSLFVNLLSVFFVIAGTFSILSLRREAFPEVSFDTVIVSTFYKGAGAKEVERLLTSKLEKELKEVDNVHSISSRSIDGASIIGIEISPDASDKSKVVDDIQKAVDRVSDFPKAVDQHPQVVEISSKQIPVIKVALSGPEDEFQLREAADQLKERLEDIDGVAKVSRLGWRDEEYWVEPDISKMKEYYISLEEIMDAIARRNVTLPAGRLTDGDIEFNIKTDAEFKDRSEIEQSVIRANDLGNWLRVKDIAEVRHTFEDEREINRVVGSRAITLTVIKRESADAINIVDDVKKEITAFAINAPENVKVSTFYDLSYYIRRRLNVVRSNGIIAFFFVLFTLFLFLHPRTAIFTTMGIPIAMLATFWIMNLLGMSINLITMFGLILVLGILVDDGIIISENVYRYIEAGMPPKEAAIKGTSEVIAPVTATVLTTIAAFLPLLFMTGILGKFIRAIPLVIILSLSASLIEAFLILPSHLSDFMRPLKKDKQGKIAAKKDSRWFQFLLKSYKGLLARALVYRYKVAIGMAVVFISALVIAKFFVPFILFGSEGVEQFMIRAEAPEGTSLERMQDLIQPVEAFVSQMPQEYLDTYETQIGVLTEESGFDPQQKEGTNLAQIMVYLTAAQKRDKTAKEIVESLRPQLEELKEKLPGLEKLYFRELKEGPPVGKAVDISIRGDDYHSLLEIASEIKQYLGTLKGVYDINDSYDLGVNELQISIDEEKALKADLTLGQVAESIRNAFGGGLASTITRSKAEEEIKVLVRLPEAQRNNLNVFKDLLVVNEKGKLVRLSAVASVSRQKGMRTITHLDGRRNIAVTAAVDNKNITSSKANELVAKRFKEISNKYPGYNLVFGGEAEETMKSMHSLMQAFWIAFFLIFLILATQFNSLIQPFVVMLTIPYGIVGVVVALLIHGKPFSFFVLLGLVGLAGIVVNDSIILVDVINKMRKKGVDRRISIMEAGSLRLRPVILTTVTTVAGLSTVAYGIGGSDPFLKPMALTMAWGLLFATFLTLIVMPCIYAIVDDITLRLVHHATVRANHSKDNKSQG